MSETYNAFQIDAETVESLTRQRPDRQAILARPAEDNGGIPAMKDVLESLHSVETRTDGGLLRSRRQNTSTPFSFEIRYAREQPGSKNRVLSLQYVAGDDATDSPLERRLQNHYSDSLMERGAPDFLSVDPGQYVAGAVLNLRYYTLFPIRNTKLDEWRSDPTGSILQEMVGSQEDSDADADVAVQVMFRPAPRDWLEGVKNGQGVDDSAGGQSLEFVVNGSPSVKDLTYRLREPTLEKNALLPFPLSIWYYEVIEHPPSKKAKDVATMLETQDGKAWELCIRIFAASDDPAVAEKRAGDTAHMYRNFYEYRSEQSFVPEPLSGREIVDELAAATRREFDDRGITQTQLSTAGVVNIPTADDVATNKLRWNLASPGDGIPPGTPRFDFEAHGVDASTATREEKQIAMLDAADGDKPLWYGTGVKHGVEAGVFQDSLYHQFVGGATRQGKTTLLTNFAAQGYRGDGSGLIIDPKGLDADEFLAEWPDDRPAEDIITMDLTGEYDEIPRFNFMEIPDYLEAGTRAHTSYCEALAEDILAMVAEAGGTDKYLGALMKRAVKTVVRGLARSGETATLLDVAAVCASSDNLTRFRQQMADERFEFLRETAERLEERDDTDLEPLAGRMDEWVLNDNVRELICARESSFSINELVREGKWLVVGFDKASSETEITMVGTALIRRTYFAQRHLTPDHSFDLICDEFDRIASTESNIHAILSEAAAFDYRCTLACQAPTNQLPERVRHAIENQCGTFLSFNPGGGRDAAWISQQHTIDKDELLNLPRYKFYMRATTRDDDLTHSYQVEGFPPAREARGDPRTDEQIHELKRASLEAYGTAVETADEQRAASPFYGMDTEGEKTTDELVVTDAVERAVAQATYDTACRTGDPAGTVTLADASDAIVRRVSALEETPADTADLLDDQGDLWRRVVQHVGDDILDVRQEDGETRIRGTKPRSTIATVGEDQSAGGAGHGLLMWDAYGPLTWAGLDMTIQAASGTDADALAIPAPRDEQNDPELVDRLSGGQEARVEAEQSTADSKAGVTAQHVLQAANEGRRAIILARPETAHKAAQTIHEEPEFCWSTAEGERRYYTSPRDLRISGETMTRPGGRENVWVQEENGDIVLRDNAGTEHARFSDPGDVFTDPNPYPSGGDKTIKRPIIPDVFLADGAEPHAEILAVPEGAETLDDLTLVGGEGVPTVDPADLEGEVTENAIRLFEAIRDEGTSPVTVNDAAEHVDVSRRSVRNYLGALADAGALRREETPGTSADLFHLH